ncbi:MAG: hypothetical protein ACOYXR_08690 [Nitrospirota bacterium]
MDRPTPDVADHLERCATCRAEAKRLNAAWALLNIVEARDPSPRFTAGVWAKIEAREPAGPPRPVWSLRLAAAALAVVLAAVLPVAVWHQDTQDRPELLAQLDAMESHELLENLEVVEDLDVLLSLDDP